MREGADSTKGISATVCVRMMSYTDIHTQHKDTETNEGREREEGDGGVNPIGSRHIAENDGQGASGKKREGR